MPSFQLQHISSRQRPNWKCLSQVSICSLIAQDTHYKTPQIDLEEDLYKSGNDVEYFVYMHCRIGSMDSNPTIFRRLIMIKLAYNFHCYCLFEFFIIFLLQYVTIVVALSLTSFIKYYGLIATASFPIIVVLAIRRNGIKVTSCPIHTSVPTGKLLLETTFDHHIEKLFIASLSTQFKKITL